jgi:hypothetical protein
MGGLPGPFKTGSGKLAAVPGLFPEISALHPSSAGRTFALRTGLNRRMATYNGGRWAKGQSGNPGGRPRIMRDVQALARQYSNEAIRTLGELMRSDAAPPGVRVRAAELLLDRGWGRPLQASVSTNLDVRQLTDAELIEIILEGQAMRELPALEPAVGAADDAA